MSRKFKVGDLVRVRSPGPLTLAPDGTEARVAFVEAAAYPGSLVYLLGDFGGNSWAVELDLELLEEASVCTGPPLTQLTEDERAFAYSMLKQGHEVERVLDIIRTLRKGV